MQEQRELYAAYVEDFDTFCSAFEAVNSEMDEVTLRAAYDMLLDDAGVVLEIAYLDRSAGDAVNWHRHNPTDQTAQPIGHVSLLYKP